MNDRKRTKKTRQKRTKQKELSKWNAQIDLLSLNIWFVSTTAINLVARCQRKMYRRWQLMTPNTQIRDWNHILRCWCKCFHFHFDKNQFAKKQFQLNAQTNKSNRSHLFHCKILCWAPTSDWIWTRRMSRATAGRRQQNEERERKKNNTTHQAAFKQRV